ncbi:MAG: hypothetical protein ACRBM6_24930 [Geminicoccales bacterium]
MTAVSSGFAQSPADYQCAKDDDARRIEIRFEDEAQTLPCRVIYRPETANDTVGTVSWRGIDTLETCKAQAKQVVDRLIGEGWACTIDAVAIDGEVDVFEEVALLEPQPLDTGDQPSTPLVFGDEEPQQTVVIEEPDLDAPMPELTALLKRDLEELAATLDGNFKAEIVAYDDLNADDVADAVVLLTYDSPQPAYRQLLAAYLFDGERYQLTATRPIASSSSNTKNASVDKVDQGIIEVSLQAFEPGDSSCCPSGVQRVSLALRNLVIVEIDQDTPVR